MFPKGLVSCYRALSCYLLFVYSNLITPCVDTGVSFSHQDLYARCSPGGEFSHQDLYAGCSPGGEFSHQDLYAGCSPKGKFSHQDLYAGCNPGGEVSHQGLYAGCSPGGEFSHRDLYAVSRHETRTRRVYLLKDIDTPCIVTRAKTYQVCSVREYILNSPL